MKLEVADREELVRLIRAATHKVEDLYRPMRASMKPAEVNSDPIIKALYACRDDLMAAENAVLRLAFVIAREEAEEPF